MNHKKLALSNDVTAWLLRRTGLAGVRRVDLLSAAVASDVGAVRVENQDRAVIACGTDKSGRGFIVAALADGIGGMKNGAESAAIAIGSLITTLGQQARIGSNHAHDWLQAAAEASNASVVSAFNGKGGTTLVAIVVRPGRPACWLSVGDSRVYRASGRELTQISVDDTIAGQLGKNPIAASEQKMLLQFIGMTEALMPHIGEINLDGVDALLLTSDGVHFLASTPGLMGQIVKNSADSAVCVKRLSELSKWYGGADNASVAMIELSSTLWSTNEVVPRTAYMDVWDAFGEVRLVADTQGPVLEQARFDKKLPIMSQEHGQFSDLQFLELPPVGARRFDNGDILPNSIDLQSEKRQKVNNLLKAKPVPATRAKAKAVGSTAPIFLTESQVKNKQGGSR